MEGWCIVSGQPETPDAKKYFDKSKVDFREKMFREVCDRLVEREILTTTSAHLLLSLISDDKSGCRKLNLANVYGILIKFDVASSADVGLARKVLNKAIEVVGVKPDGRPHVRELEESLKQARDSLLTTRASLSPRMGEKGASLRRAES